MSVRVPSRCQTQGHLDCVPMWGRFGDQDNSIEPGVGMGRPHRKEEWNIKTWGYKRQLPGVAPSLDLEEGRVGREESGYLTQGCEGLGKWHPMQCRAQGLGSETGARRSIRSSPVASPCWRPDCPQQVYGDGNTPEQQLRTGEKGGRWKQKQRTFIKHQLYGHVLNTDCVAESVL